MPHLDIPTYITQVSWFIILTTAFYLILQNKILPVVATLAKLRSRLEKLTLQTESKLITTESIQQWPTLERPTLTFSFRWKIAKPCLKAFRSF